MSLYKELSYNNDFDTIKGIQFCVMSPDNILDHSVAEITKTDTYNANKPVINGLFDPRMGVIDYNDLCVTCQQKNTFCPGHFGHVKLAKPMYYIQFFDIVLKLLKCVCHKCSKLLVDPESPDVRSILNKKLSRQKKWELMYKLCSKSKKKCGHLTTDGCGAKIPSVTKDGMLKIAMEWKDVIDEETGEKSNKKQILSTDDVLRILRRISNKDAEILGFSNKYNRPEWMICTIMPVPPPSVRPSVKTDNGMRQEDDLTSKLSTIIKVNNNLKTRIEKNSSSDQIDMLAMLLQYEVATMIDNTIPGIPQSQQRTGRPIRSLTERLKSKEGRIRGNLMGKRVDFSARSVITPDPNISIDELGVPIKIAMNLTFPEIVNKYNKEEMYKLVRNGPDIYPGAKFIRKYHDGVTKRLKSMDRDSIILEDGDVVDRHLKDGDVVLFNRQPSLHRMSMMGHRIRVMPYQTFRLNVCVTPSFNADFDGDEMNMHVPQSLITSEELYQLASVPTQIISPRECKPIVSIVQDIVSGLYRMTQNSVYIDEKQLWNLVASNPNFCGKLPEPSVKKANYNMWSGKQLFSTILPQNVNTNTKTDDYDEEFTYEENKKLGNVVSITNGIMETGVISKDIYQSRTKGIIHQVYNEYGPEVTRVLFDNTQRLVCDWLILNGFSVGISDMIMKKETNDNVSVIIHKMKVNVYDILNQIHSGSFENNSIKNNHEWFETTINTSLNKAIDDVGKNVKSQINENTNRLINMIKSKAKGNNINVAQIMGCVGQQNVDGKRIPYGFDDRTLPHYTKYDDGPESRGFVENSFIDGLTPQEFFFHAMGGREGLIDTAVNSVTWDTPVILIQNNKPKYVKIGEWIDNLIESNKKSVFYNENQNKLEFLKLTEANKIYIPTCDTHGKITWGEMTAVTRHDPGENLYKVTTVSGRSVIVTEAKSLLVFRDDKFIDVSAADVTTDDSVPVTINMDVYPITSNFLNLESFMSKKEFVYGSDLNIALEMVSLLIIVHGKDELYFDWWNSNNGVSFVLPDDCFVYLKEILKMFNADTFDSNCIYNIESNNEIVNLSTDDNLNKMFYLTKKNGIIIGIVLSYGYFKDNLLNLNTDKLNIVSFLITWCKDNGINYTLLYDIESNIYNFEIKSRVFSKFMRKILGNLVDDNYKLPDVAYSSNIDFVEGILYELYITSKSSNNSISRSSKSEQFINGLSFLCSRIGVFTTISKRDHFYTIIIDKEWYSKFAEKLGVQEGKRDFSLLSIESPKSNRHPLADSLIKNDVFVDKILSIEKIASVNSDYKKMYDVTVPSTLNFCLANGMGVVDTSETGYIQRKLVKAMEDCMVKHDLTVRNANGCIIQFLYGEDGMDGCKIESQRIDYIDMDKDAISENYNLKMEELRYILNNEIYQSLEKNKFKEKMDDYVVEINNDRNHIIQKMCNGSFNDGHMYPIGFDRILTIAKNLNKANNTNKILDLDPIYIMESVDKLIKEVYVNKNQKGDKLFSILVRMFMSPKKILCVYKLNRDSFDFTLQQIRFKFYDSMIQPSEMVGVIAAQSIGEPSTQLTLNSFHGAGIADASKSVRGVPRLNELLSVTKNIKTPVMKIFLDKSVNNNKDKCIQIMNDIRTVRFKDVVSGSKIYFDPEAFNTNVKEDADLIKFYNEFSHLDESIIESPWILRLEFDRFKLHHFNLDMITLYNVLDNYYDNKISCMFSDDNSKQLVFRIKLDMDQNHTSDDVLTDLKALEHNILETLVIKGVENIERAGLSEIKTKKYDKVSETFYIDNEWMIYTAGSNLRDILGIDIIDSVTTFTNNINEVYAVLGVEAARQALYNEITDVLDGVYVNFRHVSLLIDVMTNKGTILSVNRHGINRGDIGPLAKCSFEETTDKLIKAGIFAEYDKLNGVAANVMLGQIPPCGTGDVELLIDENAIINMNEENINNQDNDFGDNYDGEDLEELCMEENFTMKFNIPSKKEGDIFLEKTHNNLSIM